METKSVCCTCSGGKWIIFFSECIVSYGENCWYPCSVHCINKTCDRFNGSCLSGCTEGDICDRGICIPYAHKHTSYSRCTLHFYDAFINKKNIEIFFTVFFPEIENYAISSSDNLPVTVALLVCACVLIIIGVVITICVIR